MDDSKDTAGAFEAFVRLLHAGRFEQAISRFYDVNIVQVENGGQPVRGREALLAAERAAAKRVLEARIEVRDAVFDARRGLAWGEQQIRFTTLAGERKFLCEAFRQRWQDGVIVEQTFYYEAIETLSE